MSEYPVKYFRMNVEYFPDEVYVCYHVAKSVEHGTIKRKGAEATKRSLMSSIKIIRFVGSIAPN